MVLRIKQKLGEGATGTVHLAYWRGSPVAGGMKGYIFKEISEAVE